MIILIATWHCSSWSNAFTTWPKLPFPIYAQNDTQRVHEKKSDYKFIDLLEQPRKKNIAAALFLAYVTYEWINFITIEKLFAILYNVVMILIVISVIIKFSLFLMRWIISLRLLGASFLFGIVNLERREKTIINNSKSFWNGRWERASITFWRLGHSFIIFNKRNL